MNTTRTTALAAVTPIDISSPRQNIRPQKEINGISNISYRVASLPMDGVLRTRTLSETRGFMKVIIDAHSDRILGFAAFGPEAGELMSNVQVAMLAKQPYTLLRDAVFAHPTMTEGLGPLFARVPKQRDAAVEKREYARVRS